MGTKAQHLQYATKGRYAPSHVLLIGDAPGDLGAAREQRPVLPHQPRPRGRIVAAVPHEALERFFRGQYAGAYEQKLLDEFDRRLPERPPWRDRNHGG